MKICHFQVFLVPFLFGKSQKELFSIIILQSVFYHPHFLIAPSTIRRHLVCTLQTPHLWHQIINKMFDGPFSSFCCFVSSLYCLFCHWLYRFAVYVILFHRFVVPLRRFVTALFYFVIAFCSLRWTGNGKTYNLTS